MERALNEAIKQAAIFKQKANNGNQNKVARANAERKLANAAAKLESIKAEYKKALANKIAEIESIRKTTPNANISQLTANRNQLQAALSKRQTEINVLTANRNALRNTANILQKRLVNNRAKSEGEKRKLEANLVEAKLLHAEHERAIQEAEEAKEALQRASENNKARLLKEAANAQQALTEQKNAATKKLAELQAQKSANNKTKQEVELLKAEMNKFRAEKARLEEEAVSLKKAMNNKSEELGKFKSEANARAEMKRKLNAITKPLISGNIAAALRSTNTNISGHAMRLVKQYRPTPKNISTVRLAANIKKVNNPVAIAELIEIFLRPSSPLQRSSSVGNPGTVIGNPATSPRASVNFRPGATVSNRLKTLSLSKYPPPVRTGSPRRGSSNSGVSSGSSVSTILGGSPKERVYGGPLGPHVGKLTAEEQRRKNAERSKPTRKPFGVGLNPTSFNTRGRARYGNPPRK